jgi:argininosuccinate lyase
MTKIWQKNNTSINEMIESYTVWNDYILDMDLIPYDIQWSKVHTKMLHEIGILSTQEKNTLLIGLEDILSLHSEWNFSIQKSQEDWHTAIESYLIQHYWDIGKKIHTGRSRNDQILVTMRLFTLNIIEDIQKTTEKMIESLDKKISKIWHTKMPGYTHTQRAMPSSIWQWLGSFQSSLEDDLILLEAAKKVNNQNPLWSIAGFWDDILGLDRKYTTEELWFEKTQENPMYCAYSRGKFENIVLQALSQIMLDLWKLASDLVLFSSREFNFFTLPDDFKTWSSVMPQKKNWDVMELVRGNSNLFLWYEYQVKEVFKNLLSGYNRDFQLTKEPYLKWVKLTKDTLEICNLVISNLWANKESLENACSEELYATQEAYELVKWWMTFRDAYRTIGKKYM